MSGWNWVRTAPKDADGSFYQNPDSPQWQGYVELGLPYAVPGSGPFRVDYLGNVTAANLTVSITTTGDTTGAADTAAITAALAKLGPKGGRVQLAPGVYYTNAPIVVPQYCSLWGSVGGVQGGGGVSSDSGTTIKPVASWSTSLPVSGVITFITGTGTTNTSEARKEVRYLWVDGSAGPAGLDGIAAWGTQFSCAAIECGIYSMTGNGINLTSNTNFTSGNNAQGFYANTVIIQACGGEGVRYTGTDNTFINVHAQSNTGDGFECKGTNTQLIGCRSDLSATGAGFLLSVQTGTGLTDGVRLIGCGTQKNNGPGVRFSNTSPSGSVAFGPYKLSGCSLDGDGQDGTHAAMHAEGRVVVTVDNTDVLLDNANSVPVYALATAALGTNSAVPDLVQASGGFWNPFTAFTNLAAPSGNVSIGASVRGVTGAQTLGSGSTLVLPVGAVVNGTLADIRPSGDTTGVKDSAVIQNVLNSVSAGSAVTLANGVFWLKTPVIIPPGVTLLGTMRNQQSAAGSANDWGTALKPASGFSGSGFNATAALIIQEISLSQENDRAHVANLMIDGHSGPASVDGIALFGSVHGTSIENVLCQYVTGNSFVSYPDSNGIADGGLMLRHCLAQACTGNGFVFSGTDLTAINCHAQSCTGDGWQVNVSGNQRLVGCRADLSANGFTLIGPSGSGGGNFNSGFSDNATLTGCGTQLNAKNGVNIVDNYTGVSTPEPSLVIIQGGSFDMDGLNGGAGGGGYAGIAVNGLAVVTITGTRVMVDNGGSGTSGPQYAIATSASANGGRVPVSVRMNSGMLSAVTGVLNDAAGSGDIYIDPQVVTYLGSHASHIASAGHTANPLTLLKAPTGALAETLPRYSVTTQSSGMTSGTLYVRAIALTAGTRVSNIVFVSGNTGITGLSHGWYVLMDASRNVVAVTADQTSGTWLSATGTAYTLAVTAAYTIPQTGLYYAGIMANGGNTPNIASGTALASGMGIVPYICASSSTGQTTPPSVGATMGALSANGAFNFYAYLT